MSSANRFRTNSNKELIEYLKNCGRIKSDLVFTVMCTVDRKHFTTDPNAAYIDGPHIVAEGKTLSSPHMHAVTLQVFADKFDKSKVALDIGYGTGYLATCMALALGENSRVVGIECISKFQNMAEDIIRKNYATLLINKRLKFLVGDGRLGCSKLGPYDIIHVGAAASNVPQMLIDQLAIGGRLVMPIGETASSQRLTQIDKLSDGTITKKLLMNVVYGDLTNVKHEDIEKQCKYYGKLYEKEKNDSSFNEEVKNIVQKVYEIENNYSKWDKKLTQVEEKLNNLEKNLKIIENENDFSSMKNEMNKKVEKINDRIQIVETGLRTMNNDLINFQNKLTEIMNDKEITQSEKLLEERKESQNINELKKEIEIRDEKLNAITLKITDMETLVSKNQTLSANIIKTMQIKYKELKKEITERKNVELRLQAMEKKMKKFENNSITQMQMMELINNLLNMQKLSLEDRKVSSNLVEYDKELEDIKSSISNIREDMKSMENKIISKLDKTLCKNSEERRVYYSETENKLKILRPSENIDFFGGEDNKDFEDIENDEDIKDSDKDSEDSNENSEEGSNEDSNEDSENSGEDSENSNKDSDDSEEDSYEDSYGDSDKDNNEDSENSVGDSEDSDEDSEDNDEDREDSDEDS